MIMALHEIYKPSSRKVDKSRNKVHEVMPRHQTYTNIYSTRFSEQNKRFFENLYHGITPYQGREINSFGGGGKVGQSNLV